MPAQQTIALQYSSPNMSEFDSVIWNLMQLEVNSELIHKGEWLTIWGYRATYDWVWELIPNLDGQINNI